MREVIEGITTADLIWADLTGGNANVFYELGIAHGLRKRTVLVAQRRDDIPFDLRGYKNHVYRVEFSSAPSLVDDLSAEMKPFLVAARHDEILFESPFTDFAETEGGPAEGSDDGADGILDRIVEFQRRASEYGKALEEAGAVSVRFTDRQTDLNEKLTTVPEGVDPIEHVVAVAEDVAALWNETAAEMERVLDEKLAPLTLVVERGAKAAIDLGRRGGNDEQTREALASLKALAAVAATASAAQSHLAEMTRDNLQYAGALRKPGTRLASMYERFAANFDRIAALGNAEKTDV